MGFFPCRMRPFDNLAESAENELHELPNNYDRSEKRECLSHLILCVYTANHESSKSLTIEKMLQHVRHCPSLKLESEIMSSKKLS